MLDRTKPDLVTQKIILDNAVVKLKYIDGEDNLIIHYPSQYGTHTESIVIDNITMGVTLRKLFDEYKSIKNKLK